MKATKKTVGSIGSLLGGPAVGALVGAPVGGVAGKALGALQKNDTPSAASPTPVVMPSPNDDAIRAARRRAQMQLATRSGRQSTVLSTSETLG